MTDRRNPVPRRSVSNRRAEDRRFDERICSGVRVRFLRAGTSAGEVLHGELFDVSASGIRILFEESLRVSEKLLVEIRDEKYCCLSLTAQVVWVESTEDGRHRVGCELCVELSSKQYSLLKQLSDSLPSN